MLLILVLAIFSILLSSSATGESYGLGMVGAWLQNSTTTDYSGNGFDLTCSGVQTNTTEYLNYEAYNFNAAGTECHAPAGVDYVFDSGNDWTFNCWILPFEVTGQMMDKAFTSHASPYYQIITGTGGTQIQRSDAASEYLTTSYTIGPTEWSMYTIVAREIGTASASLQVYVNGSLAGQDTTPTGAYTNYATRLYLGNSQNLLSSYYFKGMLDSCTLWNRSMNSIDIQYMYNHSLYFPAGDGPFNPNVTDPEVIAYNLSFLPAEPVIADTLSCNLYMDFNRTLFDEVWINSTWYAGGNFYSEGGTYVFEDNATENVTSITVPLDIASPITCNIKVFEITSKEEIICTEPPCGYIYGYNSTPFFTANTTTNLSVLLGVLLTDDLGNRLSGYNISATNLNTSETDAGMTTTKVLYLRVKPGLFNVTVNKDGGLYLNQSRFFMVPDNVTAYNITFETTAFFTTFLVDERTGLPFNVANLSGVRLYLDDNVTYIDAKAEGTPNISILRNSTQNIRIELEYESGDIVIRYVDLTLLNMTGLPVCANVEGVVHYEQLITSAVVKPVIIQNAYSKCYIAADYTRFAYQDSKLLRAFTIDSDYTFYTFDDGVQVFLASLDGAVQTYIKVDTLESQAEGYNLDIIGDGLAFSRADDANQVLIWYQNVNGDNTGMHMTIRRTDTNTIVFDQNAFANPNNFSVLFAYTTLTNVTNSTVFEILLQISRPSGDTTIKKYFDISGKSGILNSKFAFAMGFMLLVFGLTFTISRLTFSWFGILMEIASLAITVMAVQTWYLLFLQFMILVLIVYTTLLMWRQNFPTVA